MAIYDRIRFAGDTRVIDMSDERIKDTILQAISMAERVGAAIVVETYGSFWSLTFIIRTIEDYHVFSTTSNSEGYVGDGVGHFYDGDDLDLMADLILQNTGRLTNYIPSQQYKHMTRVELVPPSCFKKI